MQDMTRVSLTRALTNDNTFYPNVIITWPLCRRTRQAPKRQRHDMPLYRIGYIHNASARLMPSTADPQAVTWPRPSVRKSSLQNGNDRQDCPDLLYSNRFSQNSSTISPDNAIQIQRFLCWFCVPCRTVPCRVQRMLGIAEKDWPHGRPNCIVTPATGEMAVPTRFPTAWLRSSFSWRPGIPYHPSSHDRN